MLKCILQYSTTITCNSETLCKVGTKVTTTSIRNVSQWCTIGLTALVTRRSWTCGCGWQSCSGSTVRSRENYLASHHARMSLAKPLAVTPVSLQHIFFHFKCPQLHILSTISEKTLLNAVRTSLQAWDNKKHYSIYSADNLLHTKYYEN